MTLSLIVTTYNRPDALNAVLRALTQQSLLPQQIIIADDGSTETTTAIIHHWQTQFLCPLIHIWQPDQGFQAARIRNLAIAQASSDYLVFLDGDCIVPSYFIARHQQFAEKGYFVVGNRILLQKQLTEQVLQQQWPIETWSKRHWFKCYYQRKINRFLPLLSLPDGVFRHWVKQNWLGVKTCNLGVWRQDLLNINGFEETFQGWGYEDADLTVRLLTSGVRRKTGQFALPVFHLWHPPQSRQQTESNWRQLQQRLAHPNLRASKGLEQHQNL